MKLFSKTGQPMVDVTKISAEGNDLVMQCKLMNAYSMKIYLRPEELRAALPLLNWDIIKVIPNMLVTGTKSEESLRDTGEKLCHLGDEAVKAFLGDNFYRKWKEVEAATSVSAMQGIVDSMLPLLSAVLQDKDA